MQGIIIETRQSNKKQVIIPAMDSAAPLRLAVIGLGEVARTRHLPILAKHPRYQITAVCDVDAARAQAAAEQYNIPRALSGADILRAMDDAEAVAICTPPSAHAQLVRAALDANKAVFVEKPLAVNLREAEELAARAGNAGARALVGFNLRHHVQIQRARAWLEQGRIGRIRAVHTTLTNVRRPGDGEAWRHDPAQGGDLLFELGVHHFDLVRFLCDAEIAAITARHSISPQGQETVTVQARLGNDVLVTHLLAQDTLEHNSVELIGERGRMLISLYRFDGPYIFPRGAYDGGTGLRLQHARAMLKALPRAFRAQRDGGEYVASYRAEWEHFFQAARNQAAPLATLQDGAAATRAASIAQRTLTE